MISAHPNFHKITFPCGEPHITIERSVYQSSVVYFDFERAEEIIDLLLLCDAMKRRGHELGTLSMPYIPFSRQDRVANEGESFSLAVFSNLINGLGFKTVRVVDPHSDVSVALINNVVVVPQHEVFEHYFHEISDFFLVSPDAGALKKIYKLASVTNPIGVVECSKLRDTKTGDITQTKVHATELEGKDCYIVDDICDGGRTFVEIAKELKKLNAGKIHLMVSHGFFTNGLSVFDGLIDHIYTHKGQVK